MPKNNIETFLITKYARKNKRCFHPHTKINPYFVYGPSIYTILYAKLSLFHMLYLQSVFIAGT